MGPGCLSQLSRISGISFELLQLKPKAQLQFEPPSRLNLPTFWRTNKPLRDSFLDITTTTSKDWYFKQFEVDNDPLRTQSPTIPPRIETNPSSALLKARGWLERCLESHSNCPKPGGHIPTRLLSLSATAECPEPRIYLQLASETKGSVPYVALSYCWGGDQVLKLEKSSLHRFITAGIGIEELPRTIADAVKVTLSLGIHHIWVDALCIIQDSDEDKAREIAVMGEAYSASVVTLAVSRASSVNEGFLSYRSLETLGVLTFEIPVKSTKGVTRTSTIVESDREWGEDRHRPQIDGESAMLHCCLSNGGGRGIHHIINDSPLFQRAWTFQERLLSSRVLDFGVLQTTWWCEETSKSGNPSQQADGWHCGSMSMWGPAELHKIAVQVKCWEIYNYLSSISGPGSPLPKKEGVERVNDVELINHEGNMEGWHKLTEQYTARNLTFQHDRLPALSAIARCFYARTGYQYAAGLWLEDLPDGLLWQRSNSALRRYTKERSINDDGRTIYSGPTWSWSSVEDRVVWRPTGGDDCCVYGKVVDLQIEPKPGGNIFGALNSAVLLFRGYPKPAIWRLDHVSSASSAYGTYESRRQPASLSTAYVKQPEGDLYTRHFRGIERQLDEFEVKFDAWRPEFEASASPTTGQTVMVEQSHATQMEVYLLVIRSQIWKRDEVHAIFRYRGLILDKTLCGDYTRLGVFEFTYNIQELNYRPRDLAANLAIAQWLTSGDEQVIRLI